MGVLLVDSITQMHMEKKCQKFYQQKQCMITNRFLLRSLHMIMTTHLTRMQSQLMEMRTNQLTVEWHRKNC